MEQTKTFAVAQSFMVNLANVDFIKLEEKSIVFKKFAGDEIRTIITWEFENSETATAEYSKLIDSLAIYKADKETKSFRPGLRRS